MNRSFDYNNEEVMNILNNPSYNDEQKKQLFEKYKEDLKETRRKEIITKLNECAKNNPIITQEEYVNFLKQFNDDDLSMPFELIEKQLDQFSNKMQDKYDQYLQSKASAKQAVEQEVEQVTQDQYEDQYQEQFDMDEDITPDVTPTNYQQDQFNDTLFNTSTPKDFDNTIEVSPTVFEDKDVKELMPDQIPEALDEKGNASAIIISIIAIIVGMIVMYSIIKYR